MLSITPTNRQFSKISAGGDGHREGPTLRVFAQPAYNALQLDLDCIRNCYDGRLRNAPSPPERALSTPCGVDELLLRPLKFFWNYLRN